MRTHSIVFAVIASTTAGCASQFADRLLHRPPPITDEGVAGTLHAAHAGQIVFASAPIAANADASTPLVDHVRADQPVFARVYLAHSAERLYVDATNKRCSDQNAVTWIDVAIDGVKLDRSWTDSDQAWAQKTTLQIGEGALLREREIVLPADVAVRDAEMIRIVSQMGDGGHRLDYTMRVKCLGGTTMESPIDLAKGSITIDVDATARATLASRMRLVHTSGKHDAGEMKKLRVALDDGQTLVDLRLLGDWDAGVYDSGYHKDRTVVAEELVRDAKTCHVQGGVIVEPYQGLGQYGDPTLMMGGTNGPKLEKRDVPCNIDLK